MIALLDVYVGELRECVWRDAVPANVKAMRRGALAFVKTDPY